MLFENGQKIMFAGDSVTDAERGRPYGEGLWAGTGKGFVRLAESALNAAYPELLLHIRNMGCSGNTSRGLLARWDQDILSMKPDWVITMIGVNDIWRQMDTPTIPEQAVDINEYCRNLTEMIDKTEAAGAKMIFLTPFFMEPLKNDPMRMKVDEYGAAMKRICESRGILCVDTQAPFDEYLRHRHSSYLAWDRVHPSQTACFLIVKELFRAIGVERHII